MVDDEASAIEGYCRGFDKACEDLGRRKALAPFLGKEVDDKLGEFVRSPRRFRQELSRANAFVAGKLPGIVIYGHSDDCPYAKRFKEYLDILHVYVHGPDADRLGEELGKSLLEEQGRTLLEENRGRLIHVRCIRGGFLTFGGHPECIMTGHMIVSMLPEVRLASGVREITPWSFETWDHAAFVFTWNRRQEKHIVRRSEWYVAALGEV
ncbi:uncharacterized protein N7446_010636 [Penicillium canescens]|uniref:Uncharacterized protein n=1 Tax=Penicillium canescens TaxID=5083 RepID=A0AAD6IBE4_PENCN|nr:uncharacterized protein N7446_010636 [Penicillium canescens]KAJ6041479.1 hypothetical protein N7460_006869 [Penicillium canescens]KAJ6050527.1 hypothetical protein N7446_010636 [Penicillium canescens]KAJ6064829.1 hypothetical protein N7444_000482 [Penicillium canescens]